MYLPFSSPRSLQHMATRRGSSFTFILHKKGNDDWTNTWPHTCLWYAGLHIWTLPQKALYQHPLQKSLPPSYPPFPRPSPTPSLLIGSHTIRGSSTDGLKHLPSIPYIIFSLADYTQVSWPSLPLMFSQKTQGCRTEIAALQQAPHTDTGCWLLRLWDRSSLSGWVTSDGLLASCLSSPLSNVSKKPELEGKNAKIFFWRAARYHANNTPRMPTARVSNDKKFCTEPYSFEGMAENTLMKWLNTWTNIYWVPSFNKYLLRDY